jgi:hypothetical protein
MKNAQLVYVILLLAATIIAQPLHAQNQGTNDYGGSFSNSVGIGVYGYSSGNRSVPNELAPGVFGQSNQGVGVYGRGDISNTYSFYNEGGYFLGGKGLYARGTGSSGQTGYGARIFSDNYRGMYAQGATGWFDAYFGGDTGISTYSITTRGPTAQSLVVNLGESTIEPGDLVAMVGITPSPENGQAMLGVAKLDASNRNAVIGVAKEAIAESTVTFEDGREYVDFGPTTGSIGPNSYLVMITSGLAPAVNLSSLALLSDAKIGDRIALTQNIEMSRSYNQADDIVIGKMAGAIDEANSTIPMFININ